MTEAVELLQQNLTTDPDLRNFIHFALESAVELGGNAFAAAAAGFGLAARLRDTGIGSGRPSPVSLLLQGKQLLVSWNGREAAKIAMLDTLPCNGKIAQLRQRLHSSTVSADPLLLMQRNAEMEQHFNEARLRAEREMEALQNALQKRQRELSKVVRQAETDPLTGLFNRRAFDEKLRKAFLHTLRQRNSPLSLLLLDIDHFKNINDEFGHQVGDEHLTGMAGILRGAIREDVDMAFRFGGDEFAVVLYADYPLACDKARQVLAAMKNRVSIGIAAIDELTGDRLTLEEFIRQADSALYEAKRRGRGRVVSHPCISQQGCRCSLPCTDNRQHTGLAA